MKKRPYFHAVTACELLQRQLYLLIFSLLFLNISYAQTTIAQQQFNNGSATAQILIADQNTTTNVTVHQGTDNWDYTATSTNGQIRVVNSIITTPASADYCLEFKNYWDNAPNIVLAQQDISIYNSVTFSIAYHSLGDPENNEDLWLDYSYYESGAWVNNTVQLIDGANDTSDALAFGTNGVQTNPYTVPIPDAATAFTATIRCTFQNAAGGNDNYYIDDLTLEGILAVTPPQAFCNDIVISLDAFDTATITTADIDNGSTVDSGVPMLSLDKTNFTCLDLGANTVTLTVEDSYGLTDTCTATVTVNAYTGALMAPTLPNVNAYCDYTAAAVSSSYQCRTITPTTSDPVSFSTAGSYTIDWLYYDSVTGNSAIATENITISGLIAPTNIATSALEATTATITWDALAGITSYEVQYREVGSTDWITLLAPSNSLNLTGLSSNTDYELEVSSICNGGNSAFSSTFNFTTTDHAYCTPVVTNLSAAHYINRVRFGSQAQNIDNSSGYDNGYGDYTASIADVNIGSTETIRIDVNKDQNWMQVGFAVWIDLNNDGDFTDTGEDIWFQGGTGTAGTVAGNSVSANFTIPTSAVAGQTRMRVAFRNWWHPTDPCDGDFNGNLGEFEDYSINLIIDPASPGEISISGNGNIINDGAGLGDADTENETDFAVYDIYEGTITNVYTISNNGGLDLNLVGTPVVQISGSTDFSVTQPADTVLSIGESTTFTISYDPSTIAVHQATITIGNDDSDENPYTFVVRGEGVQTFPDTDGDGITDNVDIDDDNDGIIDTLENSACGSALNATQTEVVFLNETFGSNAATRVEIDAFTIGVQTTYCYENGAGTACPTAFNPTSLNDGEYTVYHQIANGDGVDQTPTDDIAQWADNYWYTGDDHTPGDVDGRMAIFNADEDPGIFFEANIVGVTPNVPITYGFSALNIDRTDAIDIATRLRPEVQILVFDPNGNQIATATSGLIPPTSPAGDWVEVSATFTTTFTQFTVQLVNNQLGGIGNDLAIDDIFVKQQLCDSDGDGIADTVDLDNDNDGIPNIVELNLPDNDKDATLFNDTVVPWADTNNNGMHDLYESITLLDSDLDGTPDYIDLDSDNDGIFDSEEYDGFGDVDVSGNGVGEGTDVDDKDPATEPDGDGILPMMDLNDDGVGNDHGSANYPTPADSDFDGIPDYLDVDSNDATNNPSNGTDISATIYAHLDADNDGEIDGAADIDGDGILDAFDTDTASYGSPRDIDDKYTLFFDGRNDYVEDSNVISAGDASLMAFVRITGANATSSTRVVVGQQNFYITVNTDNTVSVSLNGATIVTSSTRIRDGIWTHLAVVTSSVGKTALFINGEQDGSSALGGVNSDTSGLTIGREPASDTNYFAGEIDEVRVFNKALETNELQRMIYQELDDTNSFDSGTIIPYDISTSLGTSLLKYYKMDTFKDDILDDKTTVTVDENTGARIYNIKNIYPQTAPLPYETQADGDWTTTGTWLHGDVWDITSTAVNKDWSIVHVKHNINTSDTHKGIGLVVDDGVKLQVTSDVELQNSWYLNLNGAIDLQGEAQLVQTETSTIVAGANASLERDQQGTRNLYTYNYWSSPVHTTNPDAAIDGDESYTLQGVLMDGTDPSNPEAINFIGGLNGNGATTPIQVAEYWVWKFVNGLDGEYSLWQHVQSTGNLLVGEGYTLKGPSTDPIANEQNYVFRGVPNNGTISLGINGGNDYLVGNPYPSAIDANELINDNTHLSGTLYFWEHYGGNSHVYVQYQGGYGLYNLSGGTTAIALVGIDPGGTALKTPRRYIPVSQGFFVVADTDGQVTFENDQRIFVTEAGNTNSWFYRNGNPEDDTTTTNQNPDIPEDLRPKYRIKYNSPVGYERHLLLTVDENASPDFDWGYDGEMIEDNPEDMTWAFNNSTYVIQGIDEVTESTVLPLNVRTAVGGIIEISIQELENVPDDVNIYVEDTYNSTFHNLRNGNFMINVDAGLLEDRFRITFAENSLSVDEFEIAEDIIVHYNNNDDTLIIKNPKRHALDGLKIHNLLGQSVFADKLNTTLAEIKIPVSLKTGVYIFTIETQKASITKKQIINN
ncbi:LamG-like jellyroll fold domain-containing protein [uncultured Kordia sp.]|uniref:LamG-like jellyroll fold domain-containing protein n=1 Tax=uncultured Kordia sp. TaxID=507699 RepID=UPI002612BB0E|nr:LamG-like jellyroll fold domain-containing protein [uncultured Kordia sp.]